MRELAIRRVEVRDRAADALAARLRTEHALAQVDLRPRALPRGAILLVRSLRARVADAPAALEELLRHAARPALGPVPATAQAVLFASRAELLACLAEDASRGVVLERWWWPLVSRATTPATLAVEWCAEPEAVPAALARLASRGRAVAFVAALPEEQVSELAAAVARAHGIPAVPASPPTATRGGATERERALALVVPEADDVALAVVQSAFVRLTLAIARAPSLLCAPPIEPLRPRITTEHEPPPPDATPEPGTRDDVRRATRPARRRSPSVHAPKPPPGPAAHAAEPDEPPPGTLTPPTTDARPRSEPDATRISPPSSPPPSEPDLAPAAPVRAMPHRRPPPQSTPETWAPPVATELGGLFFLLVVAQRLGLYADFTDPRAPGIAADPWRFVERVGQALIVDPEEHEDDPVWRLLDELARDDEEIEDLGEHVAAVDRFFAEHVELEAQVVLERPALLHVNELRVDVVLALATHPIELRLSGIDIDPGWIPAAGRALHFHFE